jgi:hypothetical protein
MVGGRGGDTSQPSNATKEGDAIPPDDDTGEGSVDGPGGQPQREAAAKSNTDPDPSPVQAWADKYGYDIRLLRIHLKKTYPFEFSDLKDRVDLQELRGDRASKAIAYLEAAFLDPGSEPEEGSS